MSDDEQVIEVVTREQGTYSRSERTRLISEKVDVSVLRGRFRAFMGSLRSIIDVDGGEDLPFELEEIQFSAEITGDGEFKLLGTGVGVEVGSSVTFVLKRRVEVV